MNEGIDPPASETAPATADDSDTLDLDDILRSTLRRGSSQITTHLICLERDIQVGETRTKLHCYFLPVDANGRVRMKPLAEFLRNQIIDYAIPRSTIQNAVEQLNQTGSMAALSSLHERAKRLFTHLAKTGEGGELLLFAMAEAVFGITQVVCKMTLKTSTSMHYHGSDGVYAEARADGGLNLFWGESKVYSGPSAAIRSCLESLAPFLCEPDGEDATRDQDILLINEFANFTDERIVDAFKRYLNKDDAASLGLRHCGFALTAFDSAAYPGEDVEANADEIAVSIKEQLNDLINTTNNRVCAENLQRFDVHFICVPMPSADAFRKYFLKLLGVSDES